MIFAQGRTLGNWLDNLENQGINPGAIWSDVKEKGKELVLEDLPNAAIRTVTGKASEVVTPVVQSVTAKKAEHVISKGNVVLMAGVGLLAGGLIAGGSWRRRAVGGGVGGILGALAGFKIGLVSDAAT